MSAPSRVKPENMVNTYLFYAQRLLYILNSASLTNKQVDKMALLASVCLSLKQSWQSWLQELSVYVGNEIPDYKAIFKPENSRYPEIELLLDISRQPDNWLSRMSNFFEPRLGMHGVSDVRYEENGKEASGNEARIDLIQIEDKDVLSEEEQLALVIEAFKNYIQAVRARQAEW